jgi:hypothetical protein
MQSLGDSAYVKLRKIAEDRDITVQELIRAIVIPDWLKSVEKHNGEESQSERYRRRVARSPRVPVIGAVPGSRPKRKQ